MPALSVARTAFACVFALVLAAPAALARPDLTHTFDFEHLRVDAAHPFGDWVGGPEETLHLDSTVVHSGRYAGRIERDTTAASTFSAFTLSMPVDFTGRSLVLRGWLKLENVREWAGLWQRQDGPGRFVQFDNMQSRQLRGTQDWAEFTVKLPLDPHAKSVTFGALLAGSGRVWVDDLALEVDGKPVAEAPVVERPKTILDTDTTFASGSGVTLMSPTRVQAENLARLVKVWGFLKYHHPAVVAGRHHWDFDLFRVMPAVLASRDRAAACAVMTAWIDSLGPVPVPASPVVLPKDAVQRPRLAWISDRAQLGDALASRLEQVVARRPASRERFAVAFVPVVGNPDFAAELDYGQLREPDAGYRLLALARFWNAVEWWFPDRDVMQEDWDGVLREFVPRVLRAKTRDAYAQEMLQLVAHVHDTHCNLWSSLEYRPPRGHALVPAIVRFAEGAPVVSGWLNPRLGPACGLAIGDVIESVDGEPVRDLTARVRPFYAASNEPTFRRDLERILLRGDRATVRLRVRRDGRAFDVVAARAASDSLDTTALRTHEHPGAVCRRLSDDVAYLRLGVAMRDSVASYFATVAGAKLLVIDDRSYPGSFPIFAIGGRLVTEPTPFVKFTRADPVNPGAFTFDASPTSLTPIEPHFGGAVAVLVDATTQSSAEYHALAFRSAPKTFVVGSTTAGADGNVSALALPGRLSTMFSGIGVYWPDGRPTQRVGIVPDVVAEPTIAGLAAGRDEVFEAAVRKALGREPTSAELAALDGGEPR